MTTSRTTPASAPAATSWGSVARGTPPGMPRRRLLNWLVSGRGGALFAVLLYPILRYIAPPPQSEVAADAVVAGKVKDFPLNSGKVVRFGSRPAMVVHLPGGEFRAFSAICTHLQCTVQYRSDLEL